LPHACGKDVTYFGDLPNLLQFQPFSKLDLIQVPDYDFEENTRESIRRLTFEALAKKQGAHSAVSILNKNRHFQRDYRELLINNEALRIKIEKSYLDTTRLFFENKGADVLFLYTNRINEEHPANEIVMAVN